MRAEPASTRQLARPHDGTAVQSAVDELAAWVSEQGGQLSAHVADSADTVLATHSADTALNPASNMKVVTAAVALDQLGTTYRFTTGLYGELRGNAIDRLVLRGHGDPSLRTADLWRLAQSIARRGVRYVGHIVVDQSWFDDQFVPPAFEQQPNEWAAFRAPVSAIAVDRNTVTLSVLASEAGRPARIWFEPEGFVQSSGTVDTSAPGSGQHVTLALDPSGERLRARVGGHVAQGIGRLQFERRVDDPRAFPGYVMAELLRNAGIDITGSVGTGERRGEPRITYVESAPVSVLVRELGKRSDNFYAEMLLKALGAEGSDPPGASAAGARVVSQWLERQGAAKHARIRNGSGLFDANRLSARSLVQVIQYSAHSPRIGPDFVSQLSIGGVDGTLRSRFRQHRQTRAVRAKTGTLNGVISLSGLVLGRQSGDDAAFSFIVEGIEGRHSQIRNRIDGCVDAIVDELWGAPN